MITEGQSKPLTCCSPARPFKESVYPYKLEKQLWFNKLGCHGRSRTRASSRVSGIGPQKPAFGKKAKLPLYPDEFAREIRPITDMESVKEVLQLARTVGSHPGRWVIGIEGLVAARQGPYLLVSRPGVPLASLTPGDLIAIKPDVLLDALRLEPAKANLDEELLSRCRVEATAFVPGPDAFFVAELLVEGWPRFLVHLQPVLVNQILASPRARQFADRRVTLSETYGLGTAMPLVPYADPGPPLVQEIRNKVDLWRGRFRTVPRVILLQNNGVLVLGDSLEEISDLAERLVKAAEIFVGSSLLGGPQFLTIDNLDRALAVQRWVQKFAVGNRGGEPVE
jgi:ribulose-5-phosphate 4-epimerase/fuculose-1-phosphate aldolase